MGGPEVLLKKRALNEIMLELLKLKLHVHILEDFMKINFDISAEGIAMNSVISIILLVLHQVYYFLEYNKLFYFCKTNY